MLWNVDGNTLDFINNAVKLMIEYLLITFTVVFYNIPHHPTLRLAFVFCRLVDAVRKHSQFNNVDSYLPRHVDYVTIEYNCLFAGMPFHWVFIKPLIYPLEITINNNINSCIEYLRIICICRCGSHIVLIIWKKFLKYVTIDFDLCLKSHFKNAKTY